MENIITSILEIEQNAKERIAEAELKRNRIIADAKLEEERIINSGIKEADDRIEKINLEEKIKSDKKLAEIEQNGISEINRLDEIYSKHHSDWEEEIFRSIIRG